MKRTVNRTSNEIPSWFKLLLSTLCIVVFFGGARLVSTAFDSGEQCKQSRFSPEAPASYLCSPLAYADGSTYLDGRGRRFNGGSLEGAANYDPLVTASHNVKEDVQDSLEEEEFAKLELSAEIVDEFEEELAVDSTSLDREGAESGDVVSSGTEIAASDSLFPGWENDELEYDSIDLSNEWRTADSSEGLAFNGADFDEQFDVSLVTNDLFDTNGTSAFIGQTNATPENDASGSSGKISQVSGETPAKPAPIGRYVPSGSVGSSGEVVFQIK